MEQAIKLKSIGNARELGGYPAKGGTVKHGLLLRTAALKDISEEDKETLSSEYHVEAVIDLRMGYEREAAPDPEIPGAKNLFLPVLEAEDYPGYSPELMEKFKNSGMDRLTMMRTAQEMGFMSDTMYVDFMFTERGKKAYRAFFDCLLELPEGRSVLWHCTDGKDRTGVAAMLILGALGADRKTIMEDYLLTNKYNAAKIAATKEGLERASVPEDLIELAVFGSGAVYDYYMLNAIKAADERCGSVSGYLSEELGIGEDAIGELSGKFLG